MITQANLGKDELMLELDRLTRPYLKKNREAVLSIGIINGSEQYIFGFGEKPASVPVSYEDMIYEIGSLTKIFTTSLFADLIREELVHLDDSFGKYIPDLAAEHPITLRHLATHTSGLPTWANLFLRLKRAIHPSQKDPYCLFTMEELISRLAAMPPKRIGRKFIYSNEGMGLLGVILARQLKTDYETAILDKICKPLKMESTVIQYSPEQKRRLLQGHTKNGNLSQELVMADFPGAGAFRSTVRDMLTFLSAHMDVQGKSVSHPWSLTHETHFQAAKYLEIGLGWLLDIEQNIIWHNGASNGFSSFMGFIRDKKKGVVLLSNYRTGLLGSVDWIGFDILKWLAKNEPSL